MLALRWIDRGRAMAHQKKCAKGFASAVTEVEGDLARVSYQRQGSSYLNTSSAFVARVQLQRDPSILFALATWWSAALAMARLERPTAVALELSDYRRIYRLLYYTILHEEADTSYNEAEADESSEEEWYSDDSGRTVMDEASFSAGMFELADLYTDSLAASDYVEFLDDLFERLSALGAFFEPNSCSADSQHLHQHPAAAVPPPLETSASIQSASSQTPLPPRLPQWNLQPELPEYSTTPSGCRTPVSSPRAPPEPPRVIPSPPLPASSHRPSSSSSSLAEPGSSASMSISCSPHPPSANGSSTDGSAGGSPPAPGGSSPESRPLSPAAMELSTILSATPNPAPSLTALPRCLPLPPHRSLLPMLNGTNGLPWIPTGHSSRGGIRGSSKGEGRGGSRGGNRAGSRAGSRASDQHSIITPTLRRPASAPWLMGTHIGPHVGAQGASCSPSRGSPAACWYAPDQGGGRGDGYRVQCEGGEQVITRQTVITTGTQMAGLGRYLPGGVGTQCWRRRALQREMERVALLPLSPSRPRG